MSSETQDPYRSPDRHPQCGACGKLTTRTCVRCAKGICGEHDPGVGLCIECEIVYLDVIKKPVLSPVAGVLLSFGFVGLGLGLVLSGALPTQFAVLAVGLTIVVLATTGVVLSRAKHRRRRFIRAGKRAEGAL